MFDKRILALRRKQFFWITALLLFVWTLGGSEVPHLADEIQARAHWPDIAASALAVALAIIGMLVAAHQYGRTMDEIETLK